MSCSREGAPQAERCWDPSLRLLGPRVREEGGGGGRKKKVQKTVSSRGFRGLGFRVIRLESIPRIQGSRRMSTGAYFSSKLGFYDTIL